MPCSRIPKCTLRPVQFHGPPLAPWISALSLLSGGMKSPESNDNAEIQGASGGPWNYTGRNVHFGIREHGMGAVVNGMAAHGGVIPFGATFLVFSDYMRPSIRLAALSK